MILVSVIGQNIKYLREKGDFPQSYLAKKAGVSQSQISLLERGHGNPTIEFLNAVAEALGVDPMMLILGGGAVLSVAR
jgi:transcriptional regulator with XRE-family HTH domain